MSVQVTPPSRFSTGAGSAASTHRTDSSAAMSEAERVLRGRYAARRETLAMALQGPMRRLARSVATAWGERDALDRVLLQSCGEIPCSRLLYVTDGLGTQVSSNVLPDRLDDSKVGQQLAERPFLKSTLIGHGFWLSDVYVSDVTRRTCLTAVHEVRSAGTLRGFVAADFDLGEFVDGGAADPLGAGLTHIAGDPVIRDGVFRERRRANAMDEQLGDVVVIADELIRRRGVFHAKLHFSSSRVTLWRTDDPYDYRVHLLEDLLDPVIRFAYPDRGYPEGAKVDEETVGRVLERLIILRLADDFFYLRSGSVNVVNGRVGLTFSCDGSYYLDVEEFLASDDVFWYGAADLGG